VNQSSVENITDNLIDIENITVAEDDDEDDEKLIIRPIMLMMQK
jgi:hypothetical protein